jgi:hypothetical protein
MVFKASILLASAFALSAFALPIPSDCPDSAPSSALAGIQPAVHIKSTTAIPSVTADDLIKMAPATASCAGAPFPEECADATAAAAALNASFKKYNIATIGEQAALIGYTLFESGDYKYSKNHYPGTPGQGTRMMALPQSIAQYAAALVGPSAVTTAAASGGDVATLALVNADDETSFGAAAWFYSSKCSDDVKAGIKAQTVDGWHAFLTQCVGTQAVTERDQPWVNAKQILLGKQTV